MLFKYSDAVDWRCSIKRMLLKISQNSKENKCVGDFFNKVTVLRPATLLKKSLWHRFFPVNFTKFLRIPFFVYYLRWLPQGVTKICLLENNFWSPKCGLFTSWRYFKISQTNTFLCHNGFYKISLNMKHPPKFVRKN